MRDTGGSDVKDAKCAEGVDAAIPPAASGGRTIRRPARRRSKTRRWVPARDADRLREGVEHLHESQWVLVVWKREVTLMVS
jgi:hypothetical protein